MNINNQIFKALGVDRHEGETSWKSGDWEFFSHPLATWLPPQEVMVGLYRGEELLREPLIDVSAAKMMIGMVNQALLGSDAEHYAGVEKEVSFYGDNLSDKYFSLYAARLLTLMIYEGPWLEAAVAEDSSFFNPLGFVWEDFFKEFQITPLIAGRGITLTVLGEEKTYSGFDTVEDLVLAAWGEFNATWGGELQYHKRASQNHNCEKYVAEDKFPRLRYPEKENRETWPIEVWEYFEFRFEGSRMFWRDTELPVTVKIVDGNVTSPQTILEALSLAVTMSKSEQAQIYHELIKEDGDNALSYVLSVLQVESTSKNIGRKVTVNEEEPESDPAIRAYLSRF